MPGNTIFYAYVRDDSGQRVVIAFASRHVADEWWRAISSTTNVGTGSVRRISAQFYSYNPMNIPNYYGGNPFHYQISSIASHEQFRSKLFVYFDYMTGGGNSMMSIIPEQEVIDHFNGDYFYIRSKNDPRVFWNYPAGNAEGYNLSGSTTARTRFCITAADTSLEKGTVLIGTDKVILQITDGLYVGVSDESSKLVGSDQPYEFLFGDFMGRKYTGADELEIQLLADQSGEAWELA